MPPRAAIPIIVGVLCGPPASAQEPGSPTRVFPVAVACDRDEPVLVCVPPGGQTAVEEPQPDAPGPYVIDVRGVISGLPSSGGFLPALPANTLVPARGFGFDLGAHVYLFTLGRARVGVGANIVRARGRAASDVTTLPAVEETFTALTPQVSFNFGTREGWSHLSAGYGRGRVEASAEPPAAPAVIRDSGRVGAVNYGGGARWFLSARVAVGFDVRFHRLSAGSATPGATLVAASVGLSLR